ncbi:MAG: hypothetical protein CME59_07175 [Halioglobus sp.]|nr:hypothetical protein [Halioglobus sp.]|tara:strand:+ start:362 stop:973 length:612 start_codon:yes stop_codon:yes gene_type:complete
MKVKQLLAAAFMTLLAMSAQAMILPTQLNITFDEFPSETAFGMWEADMAPPAALYQVAPLLALGGIGYDVDASSPIGFGDGFVLPGDFCSFPGDLLCFPSGGEDTSNGIYQFVWDLAEGDYTFIILDTFLDGLCCGWGDGGFSLVANGEEVGSGGEFQGYQVVNFTVRQVAQVAAPAALPLTLFGLVLLGVSGRRRTRRPGAR